MSPKGILFVAIPVILGGLFFVLMGLGVIQADPEPAGNEGPRWLVVCAGLVFVLGGAALINGYLFGKGVNPDGSFKTDTSEKVKSIQNTLGLGIIGIMLSISGWISFGPGERKCSGELPFGNPELSCRIAFGISSEILLFILIYGIKSALKKK